jgi:hypothetical protein
VDRKGGQDRAQHFHQQDRRQRDAAISGRAGVVAANCDTSSRATDDIGDIAMPV